MHKSIRHILFAAGASVVAGPAMADAVSGE